jgi:hypothetical protein
MPRCCIRAPMTMNIDVPDTFDQMRFQSGGAGAPRVRPPRVVTSLTTGEQPVDGMTHEPLVFHMVQRFARMSAGQMDQAAPPGLRAHPAAAVFRRRCGCAAKGGPSLHS